MSASKSLFPPHSRLLARGLVVLALWISTFSGLAPRAAAQSAKPDQVLWTNNRGQVSTVTGRVTSNALDEVVVETSNGSRKLASDRVVRIVFGDVPPSFKDGSAYFDRKDYENAAAKFALAAGDSSSRDVVRAAARLQAARAWMSQGAMDVAAFTKALDELQRFATEAADNRDFPRARLLTARATLLAGQPKEAAELYRAIYKEQATGTVGYSADLCLEAGTLAAAAYLGGEDTLKAREIYKELEGILPGELAQVTAEDPRHAELAALQARVRLGEGFALLTAGAVGQARSFFQGQLSAAETPAHRWGATLGLAETLQLEGAYRQAQIEFAKVSAIDHTDRDRSARALIGLAECSLAIGDGKAKESARTWLETVLAAYGDTPSVRRANDLIAQL